MSDPIIKNFNPCFSCYSSLYKLSLNLFYKCNLRCDFCYQDNYDRTIDIEAIKNIPRLIRENFPDRLRSGEATHVSISIKGGELFSDDIDDSIFTIYQDICNDIIELIKSHLPDIKIKLEWLSNGVYTKYDRILSLFNNIMDESIILFSYDPIGRFKTKKQFKLFEDTFNFFYNYYNSPPRLHLTLTKSNINSFVNNEVNFLNNNINAPISVNYYTPNSISEQESPSDDDLFNFYKWVIDNNMYQFSSLIEIIEVIYFNRVPIKVCIPDNNIIYCNKKIINNNKCELFNVALDKYFKNDKRYFKTLNKRGCLMCEYNNICTEPCWCGSTLIPNYKIDCYAKRTIKYVYDNPDIKNRYAEYKEKIR